jgi:hypothetical protein
MIFPLLSPDNVHGGSHSSAGKACHCGLFRIPAARRLFAITVIVTDASETAGALSAALVDYPCGCSIASTGARQEKQMKLISLVTVLVVTSALAGGALAATPLNNRSNVTGTVQPTTPCPKGETWNAAPGQCGDIGIVNNTTTRSNTQHNITAPANGTPSSNGAPAATNFRTDDRGPFTATAPAGALATGDTTGTKMDNKCGAGKGTVCSNNTGAPPPK